MEKYGFTCQCPRCIQVCGMLWVGVGVGMGVGVWVGVGVGMGVGVWVGVGVKEVMGWTEKNGRGSKVTAEEWVQ